MRKVYDYSSTQVNLPRPLASQVIEWGRKHIPDADLYTESTDTSLGREDEPHVTVLYGFYETNARKVKLVLEHEKPFDVTLGKVSIFQNDLFDVIKIDVFCPRLHKLNELLKDHFEHKNVFPVYCPHVTIAYVKKGRGKKLEGDQHFDGEEFNAKQILFSNKNGHKCLLSLRGRNTKT